MTSSPFLKWAGGKRWLAPKLVNLLETPLTERLVEPFLGSGAAFFLLEPRKALLADSNPELIATFRAVRDEPERVIRDLSRLSISVSKFRTVRDSRPRSDISQAVRLIYLNRTAFNGLYRVNRRGRFNVPFGCKDGTELCDAKGLRRASQILANAELHCSDFRETLKYVDPAKDIVYVDPPYTVKHDNNGFRRYNDQIFTWSDQEELADHLVEFAKGGARLVISNAHHREIRRLYPAELFHAFVLERPTNMAARPSSRGTCAEWILVSKAVSGSRCQVRRKLRTKEA